MQLSFISFTFSLEISELFLFSSRTAQTFAAFGHLYFYFFFLSSTIANVSITFFLMLLYNRDQFLYFSITFCKKEKVVNDQQYRSLFGITPSNCGLIWGLVCRQQPDDEVQPKHFLWALFFLKKLQHGRGQ